GRVQATYDAGTNTGLSGATVAPADFGDPLTPQGNGYMLCLVAAGPTPAFLGAMSVRPNNGICDPANGTCWQVGPMGYRKRQFVDGGGGIRIQLRGGEARRGRITVK